MVVSWCLRKDARYTRAAGIPNALDPINKVLSTHAAISDDTASSSGGNALKQCQSSHA